MEFLDKVKEVLEKKTKTNADKAKAIVSENKKGKIREFCYIAFIPITLLNHQVDNIIF